MGLAAGMLLSCDRAEPPAVTTIAQPNILFVAIDDLNDWVGHLGGNDQSITPHLDAFAERSVNFTRNYCASPGCNPSRTAVLTGLHTYRSGMYSNYQDWRDIEALRKKATLPAYFRSKGYYSAGAGKIFHYGQVDTTAWDHYYPSVSRPMPDDPTPDQRPYAMPAFRYMYNMFDWAPLMVEDSAMGDFKSVEFVGQRMREKRSTPFFLACGIYRPHLPWYVPQSYFDKFPLEKIKRPPTLANDVDDLGARARELITRGGNYHKNVVEAGQWEAGVQGYLASVNFADAMFGRLMKKLEDSGAADSTIVVVWSDHGWQLGEKEHWRKFALWENVTRTVLMIHVPPGLEALPAGSQNGQRVTSPTSLLDIYPTLMELAGLSPPDYLDGRSLVPQLRNPTYEEDRAVITTYDYGDFSVRRGDWHYIRYIDGTEELYDLAKDEHEWYNLANQPETEAIKASLAAEIPVDQVELPENSLLELMEHHIPPVRSPEYYQSKERREWLRRFDLRE